jgi:hypothetical protein
MLKLGPNTTAINPVITACPGDAHQPGDVSMANLSGLRRTSGQPGDALVVSWGIIVFQFRVEPGAANSVALIYRAGRAVLKLI